MYDFKDDSEYFDKLNTQSLDIKLEGKYVEGNKEKLLINCIGYIDAYNAKAFSTAVSETLFKIKPKIVVLNLESVNYLASMGVGSIISLLKGSSATGSTLKLMNVNPKVMDVLSLLGFKEFFTFIDDLSEIDFEPMLLFPVTAQCPTCFIKLKVPKPGKFICKGCKNEIRINQKGELE